MKYLSTHLESIAYSLTVLILFQSCVIYQKAPFSINELNEYHDAKIKIETTDGYMYKVRWFEENENDIISIVNTEKYYLKAENIQQIKTAGPYPVVMSIDDALNYNGILDVSAKDKRGKIQEYRFIEFTIRDNIIQGLTKIGSDTTRVVINKDHIKSIKVQDKIGSTAGNVAIGLGAALALITTIALIQASQEGWF